MVSSLAFPGAIYDAHGRSLDSTVPDLQEEDLDAYPHRSLVMGHDSSPIARVWLLADNATPQTVPPYIMAEAVRLVLAGQGVLIAAKHPAPEADVRDGLLLVLDLATALPEEARQT